MGWLVISRGEEQEIHLTGGITIKVMQLRADRVRLGIQAPPEVSIVRDDAKATLPKEVRPCRS